MSRTGRPTVFTDDTMAKIRSAIRAGLSRRKAAQFAGVSWDTWCKRARRTKAFVHQIELWEAEGLMVHAAILLAAAKGQQVAATTLKAAMFYLRTHDREGWSDPKSGANLEVSIGLDAVLQRVRDDRMRHVLSSSRPAEMIGPVQELDPDSAFLLGSGEDDQ